MDRQRVQDYLHKHIPLSRAMGVQVLAASWERVELFAPLEPNINHRSTVFGGSAAALATLSAWSLLHLRLTRNESCVHLVIQRNHMNFEAPIKNDFNAVCSFSDLQSWERFTTMLERKKRARINMTSVLECDGKRVGGFAGDFVAIRS